MSINLLELLDFLEFCCYNQVEILVTLILFSKYTIITYIGGAGLRIKADEIKIIMAEQGLSCTCLAIKSGISRQALSSILLKGTCNIVTAGKIAKALGVPVQQIAKEG